LDLQPCTYDSDDVIAIRAPIPVLNRQSGELIAAGRAQLITLNVIWSEHFALAHEWESIIFPGVLMRFDVFSFGRILIDGDRRHIQLIIFPTALAIEKMKDSPADTNAILHVTC